MKASFGSSAPRAAAEKYLQSATRAKGFVPFVRKTHYTFAVRTKYKLLEGIVAQHATVFGSLEHYQQGSAEMISGDVKHYAFSNIYDVAAKSQPYEKVVVGKNLEYVLEAIRAEGTSPWYAASHDEFVLN